MSDLGRNYGNFSLNSSQLFGLIAEFGYKNFPFINTVCLYLGSTVKLKEEKKIENKSKTKQKQRSLNNCSNNSNNNMANTNHDSNVVL